MTNRLPKSARLALVVVSAIFALMVGAVLFGEGIATKGVLSAQEPTGAARLTSVMPLPAATGEMCEFVPASASSSSLFESASLLAPQQQGTPSSGKAAQSASAATPVDFSKRKPVRDIRDPSSNYSAVAVDLPNNEVVLADETQHAMLVYDRQANTPPKATLTEPKRKISGTSTKLEYPCGIYVDPKSGDIYAIAGDTLDTMLIFSRQVKGDMPPTRKLETPHGTFGIAVDEDAQEMFLTVQHDSAIVVYSKTAKGADSPVRLVQGDHTLLQDPHGIALDTKNNLMYVTNHGNVHREVPPPPGSPSRGDSMGRGAEKANWPLGTGNAIRGSGKMLPPSITVYSKTAAGDAPALRVIQGPKTQLNWPAGIAVDPDRDELFVANDMGDSVLVFRASASGDVAPIRVLKGPQSLIKNPIAVFVDSKNDELWVTGFGNHAATVYKLAAEGNMPPLRIIRSAPLDQPSPGFSNPEPIAYDTKREEILVPN